MHLPSIQLDARVNFTAFTKDFRSLTLTFKNRSFMRFGIVTSCCIILGFCLLSGAISAQKTAEQKVVSGTVLLKTKSALNTKALISALKNTWKLKTDSISTADKTMVINMLGGATVMIAYLDYPAAPDEVGAGARLSWLWQTAHEETANHQAQVVVSVIGPGNKTLELYKLFTQTAAAVLETAPAAGIFLESQYLLLSPGYFIAAAKNMVQNQSIPLYCWVYFGRPGEGGGFTYGLSEFGLAEMEIANSTYAEAEVHETLYGAAMSVVKYGTQLTDGQTVTTEEGEKMKVTLGAGTYMQDLQVLRLDY
jgi:hypothetical protein